MNNRKESPLDNLKRKRYLRPIQFTTKELVAVLGAGETKIREWITDGRLRSYKIDGTVFVHSGDVARFVDKHRRHTDFDFVI